MSPHPNTDLPSRSSTLTEASSRTSESGSSQSLIERAASPSGSILPTVPRNVLTSDARIFKLDMSFNRHDPKMSTTRRFACDIDPLTSPPSPRSPELVPSDLPVDASPEEWKAHYCKWSFPLRTDAPRGLTWGPFHIPRSRQSDVIVCLPFNSLRSTKRTHKMTTAAETELSAGDAKRRRILPILRHPCNPLIVCSTTTPSLPSYDECWMRAPSPPTNHLVSKNFGDLVGLQVSPTKLQAPPKSRIILCSSSRLKYGS